MSEITEVAVEVADCGQEETGGEKGRGKRDLTGVFSKDFLIDSQFVGKKDIKNYITGRSVPILGEDYYSGYVWKNGVLSFISIKSDSYDVGKVSVFTPAFLAPGEYYYRDGVKFYVISADETGFLKTVVHYERPVEGLDLSEYNLNGIAKEIPQTLYFQWSLTKNQRPISLFLLAIFVLTLICYAWTAQSYSGISQAVQKNDNGADSAVATKPAQLSDITPVIEECVKKVNAKGIIRQVRSEKDAIVFSISFPDENDARDFIAQNGGKYENNQVVLALVAAGNSQHGAGK